jgi:hypothetical protein
LEVKGHTLSTTAATLVTNLKDLSADILSEYQTTADISYEGLDLLRNQLRTKPLCMNSLVKVCFLMRKYTDHESIVDCFISLLLNSLGFSDDLLFAFPQLRLPLYFGSKIKESKGDFIIMDILNFYRVAVIKDKNYKSEDFDSLPQLCAELIALAQNNSHSESERSTRLPKKARISKDGLSETEKQARKPLVGIRVNGKIFQFYLFSISDEINHTMETGRKAISPTVIYTLHGKYDFFVKKEREIIITMLDRLRSSLTEITTNSSTTNSNETKPAF